MNLRYDISKYPAVQHSVHESLQLDAILSQLNPVHILTPDFSKTHFELSFVLLLSLLKGIFRTDLKRKCHMPYSLYT
jgi:hypothetical protein